MADSDLAELRKQCVDSLYLCAENVTKYLDHGKDVELSKLKNYLEFYCLSEAQQNIEAQVLNGVKDSVEMTNIDQIENIVFEQLQQRTQRNVRNHSHFIELEQRIQRSSRAALQNLDESDLAITETSQSHVDPITKKPIQDPVKSMNCGHVYEREVIYNYITSKKVAKCPVSGCAFQHPLKKGHLVSDEEYRFRISIPQQSTMLQEDAGYSQEY